MTPNARRLLSYVILVPLVIVGVVIVTALVNAEAGDGSPSLRLQVPEFEPQFHVEDGAQLVPAMAEDGTTMTGPDGRERCVVLSKPPATGPQVNPDAVNDVRTDDWTGKSEAFDRPLTLADTVPC